MARDFVRASSQYLSNANGVGGNTAPVSMAGWIYPHDITSNQYLIRVKETSTPTYWEILARGDSGDVIQCNWLPDGTIAYASTTSSFTQNSWQHAAAVFNSLSIGGVRVYLDGGNKGTNALAGSGSNGSFTDTVLGGGPGNYYDGLLAEWAIWNAELTDAEIAILAKGVSPLLVRPQSLAAYWPLASGQSPEIDIVGGYDLTLNAAPTIADHAPVAYSFKRILPGARAYNSPALSSSHYSTKLLLDIPPTLAVPPSSNYATLGLRNRHPVLQFDDTSEESTVFSMVMPQVYDGGNLSVIPHVSAATATSGDVRLGIALERIGDSQQDVDSDDFNDANTQTITLPATSGYVTKGQVNFLPGTDMDNIAKGERFRIKITRNAASGLDDMSGDLELHSIELRELA